MCYRQLYDESIIKDYHQLLPEIETGSNIEYKRYLKDITERKLDKRVSQMLNRLCEGFERNGNSTCVYLIGINDSGSVYGLDKKELKESLKNLRKIVNHCNNNAKIDHIISKKLKSNRYIVQVNISADDQEYIYDLF